MTERTILKDSRSFDYLNNHEINVYETPELYAEGEAKAEKANLKSFADIFNGLLVWREHSGIEFSRAFRACIDKAINDGYDATVLGFDEGVDIKELDEHSDLDVGIFANWLFMGGITAVESEDLIPNFELREEAIAYRAFKLRKSGFSEEFIEGMRQSERNAVTANKLFKEPIVAV